MGKEKKWILKDIVAGETVARLSSELGIDPVLARLLVQRGIGTFQEARAFFRPSLDNLHDPFLMKDMDKAVERVEAAVEQLQNGREEDRDEEAEADSADELAVLRETAD